jgi:hypothetical protein
VFPKTFRFWLLFGLLAIRLSADGQNAVVPLYHLQDFTGPWRLVTNLDSTVTAMETAIHRDGNEVYSRVLALKPVIIKTGITPGTRAGIRNFIQQYTPPQIPYTSPAVAKETGTEKFNCLEFAEDIVSHASDDGISAEVIGIKLKGKMIGHACAGFPTADGDFLYFDSTPNAGKISEHAHQAFVQVGEPYRRSDGGELGGGVGHLPISEVIPVTKLVETPVQTVSPTLPLVLSPFTSMALQSEEHVQARGILYAEENSLKVADAQLEKWQHAIEMKAVALQKQVAAQKLALQKATDRLTAKALQNNQELAAQGDPYSEMRMGERYLTGDGVPKDLIQARACLEKAAAQGSPTAAEDLDQLNNL